MARHYLGVTAWTAEGVGSATVPQPTAALAVEAMALARAEYGRPALTPTERTALVAGARVAVYERGHAAPAYTLAVEPCDCGWPERH